MLIAQITDLHVVGPDTGPMYGADANRNLAAALVRIEGLKPRPDLIVATGDLTDNGTDEEYLQLRRMLDECKLPVFLVAGNHDERDGLSRHFLHHRYLPTGPGRPLQWVQQCGALRIVGIDSTTPGRHDGSLDADRLSWLDDALAEAPDQPTVVAMHHPPFETGIWWMDRASLLSGGAEFRALIARHPQVVRVLCGHHHRSIQTNWGSTMISVCPSTAHQVHLDLEPEALPRFNAEPAAFQLHHWNGSELVTNTMPVHPEPDVLDLFDRSGSRWERLRRSLRDGKGMRK